MEVCIKWRMHKCSIQCTITTCGKMLELFMFSLDRQMTQHDVFQRVVETTKWLVRRCLSFVSELIKGSLWWHRYLCDLGGLCSNISRLNYDCPVFDCVVLIYFCRMLFLSTLPSMVFQPSEIAFYASHWDELLRKVLCVVAARIDMQYSHTYYIYIYMKHIYYAHLHPIGSCLSTPSDRFRWQEAVEHLRLFQGLWRLLSHVGRGYPWHPNVCLLANRLG